MKRLISFITMAICLAAVSCQKTADIEGVASASFSISVPQEAVTKAYGDGMYDAKNVIIGVFDEKGTERYRKVLPWAKDVFTQEVTLTFVIGKQYQIVFWAQYGDAYGKCEEMKLDKITMPYEKSNQENLDAFYAYVPTFKVTGDFSKTVVLKRPFAQINFATTPGDIDESVAAGIDNKVAITLSNAAKTLDLFTGETSDFGPVEIPATEFAKDADGKYYQITVQEVVYDVIAMNYVLVNDKEAEDGLTVSDMTMKAGEVELTVPNAQMKRNYKTNIVGELLTGEGTFSVSITPAFDGEYNKGIEDVK